MTRTVPFDEGEVHVPLFKEYGEMIGKSDPSHYLIFTSRSYLTCKEAWRKFNRWKRAIAKAMRRKIEYLFIYDRQHRDEPHIHAFLVGAEGMDTVRWANRWKEMVGKVKKLVPYDPNKGARFYLGKKLLRDDCEVILSRGFLSLASTSKN